MSSRTMCRALFVSSGKESRRDDGAAVHAAKMIEQWDLPGVRAIHAPQLTRDLADEIAWCRLVIFADSYAANSGDGCRISAVTPTKPSTSPLSCTQPGTLLWYARDMYDRCPTAWSIGIPAINFGTGEELSPTAQAGVREAAARVRQLISQLDGDRRCIEKAGTTSLR